MTSVTIVVLLFVFGALTYFSVQYEANEPNRERAAGPLAHRLMSMGLTSEDGDALSSAMNSLELDEEEERPQNRRPPRA
jgi:hypothetical protein